MKIEIKTERIAVVLELSDKTDAYDQKAAAQAAFELVRQVEVAWVAVLNPEEGGAK